MQHDLGELNRASGVLLRSGDGPKALAAAGAILEVLGFAIAVLEDEADSDTA